MQGVGAKAAIAILTALAPSEVEEAIMAGDKAMITRADGIGPKIATRIVNELAEKLGKLNLLPLPQLAMAAGAGRCHKCDEGRKPLSMMPYQPWSILAMPELEVWSVLRALTDSDDSLDSAALIGVLKRAWK